MDPEPNGADNSLKAMAFRLELLIALKSVNPHSCTCGECKKDEERAKSLLEYIEKNGLLR